jgi:spermidine synthase
VERLQCAAREARVPKEEIVSTSRSPSRVRAAPGIHFSESAGLRHLHVGGSAIQSAMWIDTPDALALAYTQAMMAALLFQPEPQDAVLIGLGGGSLAKFIYRQLPATRISALEVDVRVVAAAHRMFHLPIGKRRLRVLIRDGAEYVAAHRHSADVIFLDAFVNFRQAPSVRSAAFYRAARSALRPDGVMAVNYMSDDPGLRAYLRRLAGAFDGRLLCLRAIGEDNLIVFAFADDPGVVTPSSLVGRAIALQQRHGLPFRDFASRLRPLHRLRVGGRTLLTLRELRASGAAR